MVQSLIAETFSSTVVNLMASLSFLFVFQPWISQAVSPVTLQEGGLLGLQSTQGDAAAACVAS